jgi:hypothetical protein
LDPGKLIEWIHTYKRQADEASSSSDITENCVTEAMYALSVLYLF